MFLAFVPIDFIAIPIIYIYILYPAATKPWSDSYIYCCAAVSHVHACTGAQI